jgi:hypothetical protein
MSVYLIVCNVHPADDSPEEAHRAELRAGGFRSIIERRFAPEQRRQVSATCFFVDTSESLATLTAFTESSDELYIVPLTAPLQGRSPEAVDTHAWLASRLREDAQAERR